MSDAAGTPDLGPLWPSLGVHAVFLSVSGADEVFVRVLLECHEGFGVARAHDSPFADGRALLTLLIVPDFAAPCAALLAEIAATADVRFHAVQEGWIRDIERDLDLA